ncbi:MAG: hypothetical protein ACYT04_99050, partial [Nostoc sp.]
LKYNHASLTSLRRVATISQARLQNNKKNATWSTSPDSVFLEFSKFCSLVSYQRSVSLTLDRQST